MLLRFDDFAMDTARYELRRNDAPCKLEPRAFDLIAHLARHPDQVFSREQLVEPVWHGRFVSDATVSTCVKSARRALGDSGATQRYIQTVRGRGFRFGADVIQDGTTPDPSSSGAVANTTRDYSDDPSLLVLPVRSLSSEQETTQLAGGLTDGLPAILTRIPLLRLCAFTQRYADHEITPSVRQ